MRALPPLPARVASADTEADAADVQQREKKLKQRAKEQPKTFFAPVFMIQQQQQQQQQPQQQQQQQQQQPEQLQKQSDEFVA